MTEKNPRVFLDIRIGEEPPERMTFELFVDAAPITAENFRALCTGEQGFGRILGKHLYYAGTSFHRIIKGSMAQGGDLAKLKGKVGESIYGEIFPEESPRLSHNGPGLLSMSIADRRTRGSFFSLLFKADPNLDRNNIVFGKLVEGTRVLNKIENVGDEDGEPSVAVTIANCGQLFESDTKRSMDLEEDASLDD